MLEEISIASNVVVSGYLPVYLIEILDTLLEVFPFSLMREITPMAVENLGSSTEIAVQNWGSDNEDKKFG